MSRSTLTGLNTSSSERAYVALGVELGMRGDGRGRLDYRSLSVQAGVLAQVCCNSVSLWGLVFPVRLQRLLTPRPHTRTHISLSRSLYPHTHNTGCLTQCTHQRPLRVDGGGIA